MNENALATHSEVVEYEAPEGAVGNIPSWGEPERDLLGDEEP